MKLSGWFVAIFVLISIAESTRAAITINAPSRYPTKLIAIDESVVYRALTVIEVSLRATSNCFN